MLEGIKIVGEKKPVKVGIVPCNGEEIPEGTVTRFACRKVLDQILPGRTVTICLPLFVAGDPGERQFASRFPTITLDGCEKRCSAKSTERLSGKPEASLVVTEILKEHGLPPLDSRRSLTERDLDAVDLVAREVARKVEEVLARVEV